MLSQHFDLASQSSACSVATRTRFNNSKHYTEQSRIDDVYKQYSTLEEAPVCEDLQEGHDFDHSIGSFGGANSSRIDNSRLSSSIHLDGNQQDNSDSALTSKRLLNRVRRFLVGRLFKINHVLLDNQGVTPTLYHFMLLFEFLQLLFYVFFKVDITNEFLNQNVSNSLSTIQSNTINQTYSDSSNSNQNPASSSSFSNTTSLGVSMSDHNDNTAQSSSSFDGSQTNTIPLGTYFTFINFPLIPLENHSTQGYLVQYSIIVGGFYILLLTLYGTAEKFFHEQKKEELKDGTKILIRLLSLIMAAYLQILQVPMMLITLQGYMCSEDIDDYYVFEDVECGSTLNQVMTIVSSVTLIIYLSFLFLQQVLYTSGNFETCIPWGGLDRHVPLFKVTWKILICMEFMNDKFGRTKDIIGIICFFFGSLIIFKRINTAIQFNRLIYYATITQEFMIAWLYLNVSVHSFLGSNLSISKLIIMVASGLLLDLLLITFTEKKKQALLLKKMHNNEYLQASKPLIAENLLFQLIKFINGQGLNERLAFAGIIQNHLEICPNLKCSCSQLFADFEFKLQYLVMQDWEEVNVKEAKYEKKEEEGASPMIVPQNDQLAIMREAAKVHILKLKTKIDDERQSKKKSAVQKEETKHHQQESTLDSKGQSFSLDMLNLDQANHHVHLQREDSLVTPKLPSRQKSHFSKMKSGQNFEDQEHLCSFKQPPIIHLSEIKLEIEPSHLSPPQTALISEKIQVLSSQKTQQPQKSNEMLVAANQSERNIQEVMFTELQSQHSGIFNSNFHRADSACVSYGMESLMVKKPKDADTFKVDDLNIDEVEKQIKYKFLALLLEELIKKFPTSIELRIHSSTIQSEKLGNEFKAIFELMKCQLYHPTVYNRFFILKRRISIERVVVQKNEQNINLGNRVDPLHMYKYEKLYSRFIKLQYVAANSALAFWKELLQKDIDSRVLISRGTKISKISERIQDIAHAIFQIDPNGIKFQHHYAIFLKQIVNNEQEAIAQYDKAQATYHRIMAGQNRQIEGESSQDKSENTLFGENSAQTVIMVSLEAERVGTIIHCNDEIYRTLGYIRKDLIGKKINCIQPKPVADAHDFFLKRYLDTGKSSAFNHILQMFAVTAEGYLRPIYLLIKLYPQMTNKIIILGFIQVLQKLDGFDLPQMNENGLSDQNEDLLKHHYILTSTNGSIHNVSEGLGFEVGLHAKFFKNQENLGQKLSMEDIFGVNFLTPDIQEEVMTNGIEMILSTENILEKVSLEQLSNEELIEVKLRLKNYPVQIYAKRLVFDNEECVFDLYRIVIVPPGTLKTINAITENDNIRSNQNFQNVATKQNQLRFSQRGEEYFAKNSAIGSMNEDEINNHQSSISSAGSSNSNSQQLAYCKMLQDFKGAISRRETPHHLIVLSRFLIIIIIMTIAVSSVDYHFKLHYVDQTTDLANLQVAIESRHLKLIQLKTNLRSFIDVSNEIEFSSYNGDNFKRIERFSYLKQLIQLQAQDIHSIQESIINSRSSYGEMLATSFENKPLSLYRLSGGNEAVLNNTRLPFKVAVVSYLNTILTLNDTNKTQLQLSDFVLRSSPQLSLESVSNTNSSHTQMEKDLFFLLSNGPRALQVKAQESEICLQEINGIIDKEDGQNVFVIIMVIGCSVSLVLLGVIILQVFHTERNKIEIMQIFGLLEPVDIKKVYDICDAYIDCFDNGEEVRSLLESAAQKTFSKDSPTPLLRQSSFGDQSSAGGQFSKFKRGKAPKQACDCYLNSNEESKEVDPINSESSSVYYPARKSSQCSNLRRQINLQGITVKEHYGRLLKRSQRAIKTDIKTEQQLASFQTRTQNALEQLAQQREQIQPLYLEEEEENNKIEVKHSKKPSIRNIFNLEFKKNKKHKKSVPKIKIGDCSEQKPQNKKLVGQSVQNTTVKLGFESSTTALNLKEIQHDLDESPSNNDSPKAATAKKLTVFQIQQNQQGEDDIKLAERDQRQKMIRESAQNLKAKCINMIAINAVGVLVFIGFFVFSFLFHREQMQVSYNIEDQSPTFFTRYTTLFLSYYILRERIINLNKNTSELKFWPPSQVNDPIAYQELDMYYHSEFQKIENKIGKLKVENPRGLNQLVTFFDEVDSSEFCTTIFGIVKSVAEEKVKITKNVEAKLKKIRKEAYQNLIDTVISACNAASAGDVDTLQKLHDKGVDLNKGDYDNRTPLHVGCGAGHFEVVKFLLEHAKVHASPVDRWGATPLCDANPFPEIKALLLSHGAWLGRLQPPYVGVAVTVDDDQFRLYYAAFYNNVEMMDNLRLLGWNVNARDYDGRTALGVAASQGQLDAVKYLVQKGADLTIRDARGNDPLDDAKREHRTDVINYLINEAFMRNFCEDYEDGLFKKGLQQAVGGFQRKFADLKINIDAAKSSNQILELLGGSKYHQLQVQPNNNNNSNKTSINQTTSTARILEVFFATQELYLNKLVDRLIKVFASTYKDFSSNYKEIAQIVFFSFLVFQLLALTFIRDRLIRAMRDDVMKSRGILNLVPEAFLRDHEQEVERVIKSMQK